MIGCIAALKQHLGQQFRTKDLGALRYFLRTKVARSSQGLPQPHRKYVLDLLSKPGPLVARGIDTPPLSLMLNMGEPFSNVGCVDTFLGS